MYKKDIHQDYKKKGNKGSDFKFGFIIKITLIILLIFAIFFLFQNYDTIGKSVSNTFTNNENKTEKLESSEKTKQKTAIAEDRASFTENEKIKDAAIENTDAEDNEDSIFSTLQALLKKHPESKKEISEFIEMVVSSNKSDEELARLLDEFTASLSHENKIIATLNELIEKYPKSKKEISVFIEMVLSSDKSQKELLKLLDELVTELEKKSKNHKINYKSDSFFNKTLQKGDSFNSNKFEINFLGVEELNHSSNKKGFVLGLVKFEINNKSDDALRMNFKLYVDGISTKKLNATDGITLSDRKDKRIDGGSLAPRSKTTAYLLCRLPKKWSSIFVEYIPRNEKICFIEFNEKENNPNYAIAAYSDAIELEIENIKEVSTKDLKIKFKDEERLANSSKALKIDLKITNGKNSSFDFSNLIVKLFLDANSPVLLEDSRIITETKEEIALKDLSFEKMAPRSVFRSYLLCVIPDNGWKDLKLSYQAFGKTASKKQWLEWKNKKASTNK